MLLVTVRGKGGRWIGLTVCNKAHTPSNSCAKHRHFWNAKLWRVLFTFFYLISLVIVWGTFGIFINRVDRWIDIMKVKAHFAAFFETLLEAITIYFTWLMYANSSYFGARNWICLLILLSKSVSQILFFKCSRAWSLRRSSAILFLPWVFGWRMRVKFLSQAALEVGIFAVIAASLWSPLLSRQSQ